MISTDSKPFGTVITAMVTPFDEKLKIDYPACERLIEHLLSSGTTSIIVSGTTGESPTLEDAEKKELLSFVVGKVKGRAGVIMGTGSNDTAKSIKASKEAADLGADGLLVVAPYYNKPSQEGMKEHFRAVARATRLPVILYNIPGRTGVNVIPETVLSLLKDCKNLAALKDSTGSVEQAQDLAGIAPSSFRVYSGDDYLTLPFLSVGACGVISVASHIIGNEISAMIQAFSEGRNETARELHIKWLPLCKGLFIAPNPTCVKYALSRLGIIEPHLRLPLIQLNDHQKKTLDDLLNAESIHKSARALAKS